MKAAVYGQPPLRLIAGSGTQVSPLSPGAQALEAFMPASLDELTLLAPSGVLERRYALAAGLAALKPGGVLTALALKTAGGGRIKSELEAFGCAVQESAKAHHRICLVERPDALTGLDEAMAVGGPQKTGELWTQPGVFSWDRIDLGTALLLATLPPLKGTGADLGCGIGVLARDILAHPAVTRLVMIDIDRRAVEAARRNIDDPRAEILWTDVRTARLEGLDFVVMNPPFHAAGQKDDALGAAFIDKSSASLRKGGVCWLVANRQLPYEAVLAPRFATVTLKGQTGLYKVYEARR